MKKLLFLFSLLFVLQSCERDYDGGSRYVFETQVLDKNNQPLANIAVRLSFRNGYNIVGSPDNGNNFLVTKTDSNGNLRLVFPFPSTNNEANGVIQIGDFDYNSQNQYSFSFLNLSRSNFTNYLLKENPVKLFRSNEIIDFQTIINNTSTNKNITNIEIEGNKYENYKDYLSLIQNPEYQYQTNTKLEKNQTIILKYTVTDNQFNPPSNEVFTIPIAIAEENITYTIAIN